MKKFFGNHSKLFGALFGALMSIVLIAGGSFAAGAWATSGTLTGSTGTITVAPAPLVPNYTYHLSTNTLNFGNTNITFGQPIQLASNQVSIINDGDQIIDGVTVNVVSLPAGLEGAVVTAAGSRNGIGFVFQILINATPTTEDVINMSGFKCSVTPYTGTP